jgi:hypothetical protein
MKSRTSTVVCGVGMVLLATLLMGANPGPRATTPWEYGIYIESPGNYEWQNASQKVRATNPTFFFERMGFPTGIEVDARTGRVQTMVLNYLGQQGWELVDIVSDGPRDVYWLKRPR